MLFNTLCVRVDMKIAAIMRFSISIELRVHSLFVCGFRNLE